MIVMESITSMVCLCLIAFAATIVVVVVSVTLINMMGLESAYLSQELGSGFSRHFHLVVKTFHKCSHVGVTNVGMITTIGVIGSFHSSKCQLLFP